MADFVLFTFDLFVGVFFCVLFTSAKAEICDQVGLSVVLPMCKIAAKLIS